MLRLKSMRTEHNLSQKALAQKIGSSQKAVDYWEKGSSEPTARFIIALSDCFGCSADYLLGREDDYGNINIDSDLSEEEKSLLNLYRSFGEGEKKELLRFAKFLKSGV
ncbi:MAG: helix-turn-helix domain-containing protein [Clostridia bacterium]|nr:helix-turn-helix domain-containing protein [Clostridia bacterium]